MLKEKENENSQKCSRLLLSSLIVILILGGSEVIPSSMDSNKEKIISLSFFTIDKGFRSGIKEQKIIATKKEKEWEDLWRLHKGTSLPGQEIPRIDFEQEMVIAVFSGEKRTGGYGIEIKRVEENLEKGQLDAFSLETHPSPKSIVIQALTQPYHIVKLKKVDIPVMFIPGS